ncbi:MAG: cytochrome bc complex cytochrome b subunit [Acidobacteria bacterium]|nr:cytochrome bc complex cytochrome b subunit [Acidobacteriota bacterium]
MATSSYPGSEPRPSSGLYGWLDQRLGLEELAAFGRKKMVPLHAHSFWYYWGGLSLFFFLIQVTTGVLLLVYFRPGPDAYNSVRQITYDVEFGWLIRSAHNWSANLMVLAVFVHMFSVFLMKAYRNPRELGWWSGLALLGVTMVFGFSGYLLPMDELSYFATKIGLEIPAMVPVLGPLIADLVRGGPTVGAETVQRFFALHVVVLPLLFIPILMFHLMLVQKHGNAVPPSEEAKDPAMRRAIPFFPNFLAKDLAMWLIALNVVAILASMFPWSLGPQADPLTPAPLGIHPEWYFMAQFQFLKVLGRIVPGLAGEFVGIGLFTAMLAAWALVPLFDTASASQRKARAATWFGFCAIGAVVLLTVWGYWEV